jgi:uncharacterized protein GlcG (DUF336 family)
MKTAAKMIATVALSACALTLYAQQPPGRTDLQSKPPAMSGGPPPGPPRSVPPAPAPHLATALRIAKTAVAACRGWHVGVTVLDSAGYPKLIYIPDGSDGFHAYIAFRKANTALKFDMPSGDVAAAMKKDPQAAAKYQADSADFITFAGGLPIEAGGRLLGAIGVSGAEPSAKDEACARTALRAVRAELK